MDTFFTLLGILAIVLVVSHTVSERRRKEELRRRSRERDRKREEVGRVVASQAAQRGHELGEPYFSFDATFIHERYCMREGCGAEGWYSAEPLQGHLYGGGAVANDCPHPSPGRGADMRPVDWRSEG